MEDENYESENMVTPKRSHQNYMILPIECIFCKMVKRKKTWTREPLTFYVCMEINYENDNGRKFSQFKDTELVAYKEFLKFA